MNDIVALVATNPVIVLTDEAQYSEFYRRVKAETDAHVPDVSTAKGRGDIRALAFKVTRSKTAIDDAGKKLNEDARKQINAVDAQRRKIRDELDALAETVRKPLTEWEKAEEDRQNEAIRLRGMLMDITLIPHGATAQYISDTIGDLRDFVIDPEIFRDDTNEIVNIKQASLATLEALHATAIKAEADAAELARLRAENEARAQKEREEAEQFAREQAIREAEDRRAKAEHERQELAEREAKEREERAAQQARDNAEKLAQAERDRIEREANEKVAAAEAETARLQRVEEDRERARRENIEAEAKRNADRTHRSTIMGAAKTAIMTCGADEETAKKIVLAIVAGEIPNVRISF